MDTLAENLADRMSHLFATDDAPFPYEDLRKLRRITKKNWTNLNPDLNTYQSMVAGYCSWGRKALEWSPERVQQAKDFLCCSFFEHYPRYLPLRKLITPRLTPRLYADFVLYEQMRETTLQLAFLLEQSRPSVEFLKVA